MLRPALLGLLLGAPSAAALTVRDNAALAGSSAAARATDNLTVVHVAYSSDLSGFTGLLASMLSLSRRLKEPDQCVIHLLIAKADVGEASSLVQCFQNELSGHITAVPRVVVHELQPFTIPFENIIKRLNPCREQAVARLYLHRYLPDVPRVLYLDFDTIVKDDVGLLYRMPMTHALAVALQTDETPSHMYTKKQSRLLAFFRQPRTSHVVNSGVALMDLDRWRSENITTALEGWMLKTQVVEDQMLLNLEFQEAGRGFDALGTEWNVYNLGGGARWSKDSLEKAKILHWSSMWKPWTKKYGNHPNYKSYWEAPKQCPAADKHLHLSW